MVASGAWIKGTVVAFTILSRLYEVRISALPNYECFWETLLKGCCSRSSVLCKDLWQSSLCFYGALSPIIVWPGPRSMHQSHLGRFGLQNSEVASWCRTNESHGFVWFFWFPVPTSFRFRWLVFRGQFESTFVIIFILEFSPPKSKLCLLSLMKQISKCSF